MSRALLRAWLLCLSVTALAVSLTYPSPSAHAEPAAADPQPQLVYQNPQEGDVLRQPAFGIQLCFASPVNIKDLGSGGDFAFSITEPDGLGLGNRDVFQRDGYGITVYPGAPVGDSAGQWKFHYRVTSPDAQSGLEGDINYTVDPAGSPFPQETPPVCVESGGTATPLGGSTAGGGGTNNTLMFALIGVGVAGAALIVVILFVVRRRRGGTTRRPTPSSATPPPAAQSETPLPKSSPPPVSATPPPVAESEAPLPQSSPPPGPATPPPVAESGSPLPESSRPPLSETPAEDSGVGESAGYSPDNSKFALLAIAAAVVLLIGLIFRRRGGRNRHREKPDGDDGNGH